MISRDDACNAEHLMQLVRSGDPRALDHITRCYGERLLAAGKRHCRTMDEATDAVQDAWLTAAQNLDQYRSEGSLEGWLVRIVATACRRFSRGQKNDFKLHDTEIELADDSATPEQRTAEHELGTLLDQTLFGLAPEDRAILLLAELEDWTAPEIAAELGLSAGTIRTRLTRLRSRIRAALEPALKKNAEHS